MDRILLVRPNDFRITDEQNLLTNKEIQPNPATTAAQFSNLDYALKCVPETETFFLKQDRECPEMVFAANGAATKDGVAVLGKFRHKIRRGETARYGNALRKLGYNVYRIEDVLGSNAENEFFEGQAELCPFYPHANIWIGAYGIWEENPDPADPRTLRRGTKKGIEAAAKLLGIQHVVYFQLVDPFFYHRDTCLSPGKVTLYYPPAFDKTTQNLLWNLPNIYAVSEEDARKFVCNGIQLQRGEKWYFITPKPTAKLRNFLERNGYQVIIVDVSQFLLSGGGAGCLVLFLN